jgi:hypothetical protein
VSSRATRERLGTVLARAWPDAELGQHHHISGKYLIAYAREIAWKEDNRRQANGAQHEAVTGAALAHPVSRQWAGYWQRNAR